MTHQRPGRRSAAAFTMIELLVVISIIIVLASLTIGAVVLFSSTGPRTATRSNLNSLKTKLDNQWKAVKDKAQKETILDPPLTNIMGSVGATDKTDPRVRAQYVQVKLTQAFPQTFAEVFSPGMGLPPWSGYVNYLKTLGITANNVSSIPTNTPDNQSAICLMMALERGPSNAGVTPDTLGSTAAMAFPLGQGQAFGCVDAWGNALKFTRNSSASPPAPVIETQKPSEYLSSAATAP